MRYAQIKSTGRYVPANVLANAYFDELFPEQAIDGWLREKVNIERRHVMAPEETTSDLSLQAAWQALERAQLAPTDLDLIIHATDTPDYITPATAAVLQAKLGASNAGTFDINTACAGWVAGIETAARFIMTDPAVNHVLVASGYGISRFLDYTDYKTCTLFGDGAGAAIVGVGSEPGFLAGKLSANGAYRDVMGIFTGGVTQPDTPRDENHGRPRVQFLRRLPPTYNSDRWCALIEEVTAKAGVAVDEVDFFVFSQLNIQAIRETMRRLNQPLEKTHCVMDKWAYTGAACIPMVLDDALAQGKGPRPGDKVLFVATGAGISIAVNLWQWTGSGKSG